MAEGFGPTRCSRQLSARYPLLILIVFFCAPLHPTAFAQVRDLPPVPSRPGRSVTIQGQVSLSSGQPAGVVLVRLTTRGGVPRETFTNDQGRYEFVDMEEGGYVLTASSPTDATLVSDSIQTDTSHTATGKLTVNLTLHLIAEGYKSKPGILDVEESKQKIPREARKAFDKARKFLDSKEVDKALEKFDLAINLYDNYYQALSERGDVYVSQRNLKEAAADFDRALKINLNYAPALRGSGYCKLEQKDFAGAIQDFERSISVDPGNAGTQLLLGIANLESENREAAKAALLKALTFNPPAVRAHIYLGNLYAKQHMFKEAADELQKYLQVNPDDADRVNLRSIESQWRALAAKP